MVERGRQTPPEIVADALLTREALLLAVWSMARDGHVSLPTVDRYFKRSLGELSMVQMAALSVDGFGRIAESADRLNKPDHTLFPNSRLEGQS